MRWRFVRVYSERKCLAECVGPEVCKIMVKVQASDGKP